MLDSDGNIRDKKKKRYEEGANGGQGERNVCNLTVLITREMQTKTIRYNFSLILIRNKRKVVVDHWL